jgi:hypothetical protein
MTDAYLREQGEARGGGAPQSGLALEYSPAVLESIREAVAREFLNSTDRGVSLTGLLLGRAQGGSIQIRGWEPASVDGSDWIAALESQVRLAERAEREVVGWFRSRATGDGRLIEEDIRAMEQIFPGQQRVALILRPSNQRPMLAAFHLRDANGHFAPDRPTQKFYVYPTVTGSSAGDLLPATPVTVQVTAPAAPLEVRPAEVRKTDLIAGATPVRTVNVTPRRIPIWALALGGVAMATVLAGLFALIMPLILGPARPVAKPQPELGLRVVASAKEWDIRWDRALLERINPNEGVLTVKQGATVDSIPLSGFQLMLGAHSVPRLGDDLQILLEVQPAKGPPVEELARVVGGLNPSDVPQEVRVERQRVRQLEKELRQLRLDLENERSRREALQRLIEVRKMEAGRSITPVPSTPQ